MTNIVENLNLIFKHKPGQHIEYYFCTKCGMEYGKWDSDTIENSWIVLKKYVGLTCEEIIIKNIIE